MNNSMRLKEQFLEKRTCKFFQFCSAMLCFGLSLFILAPLVGVVVNSIHIPWGIPVAVGIIALSAVAAICMQRFKWFQIDSWAELCTIAGILLLAGYLYGVYAPILEIRQDPSVYTFKAFNLINDGFTYKTYPILNQFIDSGLLEIPGGYADIQNGTKFTELGLESDFYAGGAYFMALFGVFHKSITFYAQTAIMLLNTALLYFLVKKLGERIPSFSRFLLVGSFIISPISVFFGRGGFCEPGAMIYILLIAYLLLENRDKDSWVLAVIFLSCYTSRIDYLLIGLIGVLVIAYKSKMAAVVYTILSMGMYLLMKEEGYIYYDRIIASDMSILKYGIIFLVIAIIASLLIVSRGRKIIDTIFYSKLFKIGIGVLGVTVAFFMFYDNVVNPEDYHMQIIHNRNLMTYKEFIWDLLFQVFPSIVLIGGIFNYNNLINRKKIPFLASGFLIVCLTIYLYLFINAGNSPQLYWMLRRYYNIVIPILFLSFTLLIDEMNKKTGLMISTAIFLLSANLYFNTEPVPEYSKLDKSVQAIESSLGDQYDIIFYDEEVRYSISSLLSYMDTEFMEIAEADLETILTSPEAEGLNIGYMTAKANNTGDQPYQIQYLKIGELYGDVPISFAEKIHDLYFYSGEELLEMITQ